MTILYLFGDLKKEHTNEIVRLTPFLKNINKNIRWCYDDREKFWAYNIRVHALKENYISKLYDFAKKRKLELEMKKFTKQKTIKVGIKDFKTKELFIKFVIVSHRNKILE